MAINGVWNKRHGPGGSTRRLHHLVNFSAQQRGSLWGRTRFDMRGKGAVFARHDTTVIGSKNKTANDNELARAA